MAVRLPRCLAVLFAVAACQSAPRVELRTPIPSTSLCVKHDYNLVVKAHELATGEPAPWVTKDGFEIEGVRIERAPEWDASTGYSYNRFDLASGAQLFVIRSELLPNEPTRDGWEPKIVYLWNPTARVATLLGRGYWAPRDQAFFIAVVDGKLVYTDIDEAKASFRVLGDYVDEDLIGESAGTAVLYSRVDDRTVAIRCLGDARATRFAVPRSLGPASQDAVRDQRLLLLGEPHAEGRHVTAPAYVLDLDRARLRFVGTAPGRFESAFTNVPRSIAVVRLRWSDGFVVAPLGAQDNYEGINVSTEKFGHGAR